MRGSGWEDKVPRPGEAVCATFPYLLVSIGSGVSVIRVDGPDGQHQRVSGSSIGGGTFYGLAKLLVGAGAGAPQQQQRSSAEHLRDAVASAAQAAVNSTTGSSNSSAANNSISSGSGSSKSPSFEELLELAKRGDARKCDMMVGDIYGHDYQKIGKQLPSYPLFLICEFDEVSVRNIILFLSFTRFFFLPGKPCVLTSSTIWLHSNELGLSSDVVACSFGKAMGPGDGAQPEDRARALLMMVTNNIAQAGGE